MLMCDDYNNRVIEIADTHFDSESEINIWRGVDCEEFLINGVSNRTPDETYLISHRDMIALMDLYRTLKGA